ncbi:MAG: CbtB domain-containing protein [Nitrososphaera sp.]
MVSSVVKNITSTVAKVPKIAIGVLLGVMAFGIFMVGFDQGQLFAIAEGEPAYENMWMHEFYHDMRHAAGFPCH